MSHDTAAALRQICKEFSLSSQVTAQLESCVQSIRDYEEGDKLQAKTLSVQRSSLSRVKADAERLIKSLDALWVPNVTGLDDAIAEYIERLDDGLQAVLPPALPLDPVVNDLRQVTVNQIKLQLALLAQGAAVAVDDARPESVQAARALLVGEIAVSLRDTAIRPSRGGDFELVCDAVFEAAGVDVAAEGAVRAFVEDVLPSFRQKGFCS